MPLNIQFESYEELVTFLYTEKSLLFLTGIDVIKKSIKNNEDSALVANLIVDDSLFSIRLDKCDWVNHLNVSLSYFETIEDYEICQEIKELIDNI